MCSRILLSLTAGMGTFVLSWFLAMSGFVGEHYASALEITPLAALAGVLVGAVCFALLSVPRPAAVQPSAPPARRLTDADIIRAYTNPQAPAFVPPQPPRLPEDTARHWLRMDGRRKVWPPQDRPATMAVAVYVGGRKAIRYTSQSGEQHTMYLDGEK